MVNLTYKRRLFEIVLDFFLIGVSYYLAYWIRFGLTFNQAYLNLYVRSVPLALATAYFAFFILGVYRGAWRYVGVDDLVRYATASLGAVIPVAALIKIVYPTDVYSLEIFILYAVFLFFSLAASRSSFQVLDRISGRQITNSDIESVLIYGAEDAGEIALRWIIRNPELGYRPIGFLDDDPLWWGRHIHGVDILGGCEQLENILSNKHIDGIIISSSSRLSSDLTEKTIAMCHNRGVWVKVLRLEFELIE
jgi:UDP-GlcNAc:undecaprenyl-phosphate GlcNAc-1-phosphate transferase